MQSGSARDPSWGVVGLPMLLLLLAFLPGASGCGRAGRDEPGPDPAGFVLEGGAALDLRLRDSIGHAWRAAGAETLGIARQDAVLRQLNEAGYLSARVCRLEEGHWRLEPGARVDTVALRWHLRGGAEGSLGGVALPPLIRRGSGPLSLALCEVVARAAVMMDEAGRPLAEIEVRRFSFPRPSLLQLDLELRPGPAVRVSDVQFVGAPRTRPAYLRRVVGWEGPEIYCATRWQEAREELLATGLFGEVSGPSLLLPSGEGRVGAGSDSIAPDGAQAARAALVRFDLTEQAVSRLEGVLGYSGESETLAGHIDLWLGNLFGTGRAMRLFWQRHRRESSRFEFAWHEPYLWRLPLELDVELSHETEDTLFARTRWGAALQWQPVRRWGVSVAWSRERTVLGEPVAGTLHRAALGFGVGRSVPKPERRARGWQLDAGFERTTGSAPRLRRFDLALREWQGFGSWGLWLEQAVGLIGGDEQFFRSDVYRIGGSRSLRGYYEGEIRALRFALQRAELGPRLDEWGARLYLLWDLCWVEEWWPAADGVLGVAGGERVAWSAGLGARLPSRAGALRLDYAVPRGGTVGRGRLHFSLESRF